MKECRSCPSKQACTEIPAASTQETSHNRDGCLSIARVALSSYSSRFFLIDGLPQNVQRQAAPQKRHVTGREIHFLFSAHIAGEVAREHAAVHLVVLLGIARYSGYFLPTGHTFRHGIAGELLGFVQEVLLEARQVTASPAAHRIIVLELALAYMCDAEAPVRTPHVNRGHQFVELENVAARASHLGVHMSTCVHRQEKQTVQW